MFLRLPLSLSGWANLSHLAQELANNPLKSSMILLNIILMESILSVDNAAVLASMVMGLPSDQRKKALRYGIIGAYAFRGLALFFAVKLVGIWFLKPIGGAYLLFIFWKWFRERKNAVDDSNLPNNKTNEPETTHKVPSKPLAKKPGGFWATVAMVEVMDMAFSIDNVFAAVAYTDNILLIWMGVFIGILAMRYVAQYFVKLLSDHPDLEVSAFWVIALLGLKLLLSVMSIIAPGNKLAVMLESELADWFVSLLTLLVFIVPLGINGFTGAKIPEKK